MESSSGWASLLRGGRVIMRVAVAVCLASALASPSFAQMPASAQAAQIGQIGQTGQTGSVAQQAPVAAVAQTLAVQAAPLAQQISLTPSQWPYFAGEAAMQETAVRALRWAFYAPNGYRWEYSGILFIHEGQLGYSPSPRTLQKVDAVEMDADSQRAPGDTLVALYHTHPCKSEAYFPQYFSPQDLVSAFFYRVPTFILDECTGKVHEFDPVHDHAADTGTVVKVLRKDGTSHWLRLPAGRIVGDIGDNGPDLSLIEKIMNREMY